MNEEDYSKLAVMDAAGAIAALGDENIYQKLVDEMESCLDKQLLELKVALDYKDYPEVRVKLQSLKGSTLYTGCNRAVHAADQLKQAVEEGRLADMAVLYPRLIEECIHLKREVRQYIAKRDSKAG